MLDCLQLLSHVSYSEFKTLNLLSSLCRSLLLLSVSTPSGSVAPSWLLCPPSSRCGSPSRSTTRPVLPLSTGSASKPTTISQSQPYICTVSFNVYTCNVVIKTDNWTENSVTCFFWFVFCMTASTRNALD